MSAHMPTDPTPHRASVDLAPLAGSTVLGEPLDALFSALLRLRFGPGRRGMVSMTATWPQREAEAFTRAMARVEAAVPEETRTHGQRDHDRFMAVAERVLHEIQLVSASRARH